MRVRLRVGHRVRSSGRSPRGSVAAAVVVIGVALLVPGLAAASSEGAAGLDRRSGPKVVATVISVTGTNIYVKRATSGTLTPLLEGDSVYLHDIIAAGPSVTATLRLSLPDGLPAKTIDLLNFYKQLSPTKPAATAVVKEFFVAPGAVAAHQTLTLRRSGKFIILTLRP